MWIAITSNGKEFKEGEIKWAELIRNHKIVELRSDFAKRDEKISIPDGCKPIVFNTADSMVGVSGKRVKFGSMVQLSQSIGFADEEKETFIRIKNDGVVTFEESPLVH